MNSDKEWTRCRSFLCVCKPFFGGEGLEIMACLCFYYGLKACMHCLRIPPHKKSILGASEKINLGDLFLTKNWQSTAIFCTINRHTWRQVFIIGSFWFYDNGWQIENPFCFVHNLSMQIKLNNLEWCFQTNGTYNSCKYGLLPKSILSFHMLCIIHFLLSLPKNFYEIERICYLKKICI